MTIFSKKWPRLNKICSTYITRDIKKEELVQNCLYNRKIAPSLKIVPT